MKRTAGFGLTSTLVVLTGLIANTTSARAAEQNATMLRSTDVYSGPGKYPILARLERGAQVKLVGCVSVQAWCEVGAGKTHGWVSANALELKASKPKRK